MTAVDIVLHLDVADRWPGEPQTVASLREWLVPDLLRALGRVLGHPGDYGAVWAGDPRTPEYEVLLPDCLHVQMEPYTGGYQRCLACRVFFQDKVPV